MKTETKTETFAEWAMRKHGLIEEDIVDFARLFSQIAHDLLNDEELQAAAEGVVQ